MVIELSEDAATFTYSFDDLMRFHGGGSPGGVAIAFRALALGLPLLDERCQRREVSVTTAFGGPGARDAFEMALRAVSDGRYVVDAALRQPARGPAERFVFALSYRGATVTLVLRDGFVTDEFAALAFGASRTPEQDARLEVLKRELAERVLAADEVFAVA